MHSCCLAVPVVLACLLPALASAQASEPSLRLAVLDLDIIAAIPDEAGRFLSDAVRAAAREVLPHEEYLVFTRDNVLELMPPGASISDCVGDCAVEIGRKIQSDYVVSGELLRVGEQLRCTLSLFDCSTANLIGQCSARGLTLDFLESDLLNEATTLLLVLPNAARDQRGLRREAIDLHRQSEASRARGNRWLAAGMLATGGFAAWSHLSADTAWKDYHAATDVAEAARLYNTYSNRARARDIALGATGALLLWRIVRAFRHGPSEDDFYRDLLLQKRLSAASPGSLAPIVVSLYSSRF